MNVIPAQAGTQSVLPCMRWIPACAGMTAISIPACAGMTVA